MKRNLQLQRHYNIKFSKYLIKLYLNLIFYPFKDGAENSAVSTFINDPNNSRNHAYSVTVSFLVQVFKYFKWYLIFFLIKAIDFQKTTLR